jgi:WD40 repeat protein
MNVKLSEDKLSSVCFSKDDKILAISTEEGAVILFDIYKEKIINKLPSHTHNVKNIKFSPNLKFIAGYDLNNRIIIWSVKGKSPIRIFKFHDSEINTLKFTQNSQNIFSTDKSGTVVLWNVKSGVILWKSNVDGVPYVSNKGKIIASASSSVLRLYKTNITVIK